jgi:hypothetical protein
MATILIDPAALGTLIDTTPVAQLPDRWERFWNQVGNFLEAEAIWRATQHRLAPPA